MLSFTDNNYMLCIIILLIIFMFYYLNLDTQKEVVENFQQLPSIISRNNSLKKSIHFENSIFNLEDMKDNNKKQIAQMDLNIHPKSSDIENKYIQDNPNLKKNQKIIFPVHKILINVFENQKSKYKNDFELILCNDGNIYTKKIGSSIFNGPLKNSSYKADLENIIPMRMITIDKNSNLYGVGFDGLLYKKKYNIKNQELDSSYSNSMDLETEWEPHSKEYSNLIYVLFIQDNEDEDENQYPLLIFNDGTIKLDLENINKEEINLDNCPVNLNNQNDNLKIIKLMYHRSGYLLAICNNFKLYRSETKLNFNNISSCFILGFNFGKQELKHPSDLLFYDINYNNYGQLEAQVFDLKKGILKTMIQIGAYFTANYREFNVKDLNISFDTDVVLSNRNITFFKTGTTFNFETIEYGEDDLEKREIKLKLETNKKLREFCKEQNYHYETNDKYRNHDLESKLEIQKNAIKDLKDKIQFYLDNSQNIQD